jgi:hypothetical protein
MFRKILAVALILALVLPVFTSQTLPVYALPAEPTPDFTGQASERTGAGTDVNPYILHNIAQLQEIELDLDAFYQLGNDIDASGGDDFVTISAFTGVLDGQGHGIYDLHVGNNTDAFIEELSPTEGFGLLADIFFVDNDCPIIITCSGQLTGIYIYTNRHHSVGIGGTPQLYSFFGLVFYNGGYISNCGFTGGIESHVGLNYAAMAGITDTNAGIIENTAFEGNLYVSASSEDNSETPVSGFASINSGTIQTSYFTGNITVDSDLDMSDISGFCATNINNGIMENCYTKGEIINVGYASVFNSTNEKTITNCYGAIVIQYSTSVFATGFNSYNGSGATVTDCYFDEDIIGMEYFDGGGEEKTTLQMKDPDTYATWDLENTWGIDAGINDGYPYLLDQNTEPLGVNTIGANPLSVTSAEISGELTGLGSDSGAYVSFEWGYSLPYGEETTPTELTYPAIYSATLSGLDVNARVYYRAKAVGMDTTDTVYGSPMSFILLYYPTPIPATAPPFTLIPTPTFTFIPSPSITSSPYVEMSPGTLIGAKVINDALDSGGVPRSLFWFNFGCILLCIIGLIISKFTRSHLAEAGGICFGIAALSITIFPWWTLPAFAVMAGTFLMAEKEYEW